MIWRTHALQIFLIVFLAGFWSSIATETKDQEYILNWGYRNTMKSKTYF